MDSSDLRGDRDLGSRSKGKQGDAGEAVTPEWTTVDSRGLLRRFFRRLSPELEHRHRLRGVGVPPEAENSDLRVQAERSVRGGRGAVLEESSSRVSTRGSGRTHRD